MISLKHFSFLMFFHSFPLVATSFRGNKCWRISDVTLFETFCRRKQVKQNNFKKRRVQKLNKHFMVEKNSWTSTNQRINSSKFSDFLINKNAVVSILLRWVLRFQWKITRIKCETFRQIFEQIDACSKD